MLRRTERQVFSYDLNVVARAKHAQPPRLLEIVAAWQSMFVAGTCSHERERGTVIYRIGDIEVDSAKQTASILMRRCDTNAANAVYSHRQTGVPRVAERLPEEGGDRAAHLIISTKHEADKPGSYLCHLEGVQGLSHRLVQATLNAILKQAIAAGQASFRYADPGGARLPNGDVKTTAFLPTIELLGHPSEALIRDLEQGRLHDILLVDQTPKNNLGGNQYLIENENFIKVKVSPHIPSHNRVEALMAALKTRKGHFQKAKIRFTDPEGMSRTIDYDFASGALEQGNYVQSYIVDSIDPPMDESSLKLAPFLQAAMLTRVVAERT